MDLERVVYSLNVEDIQEVANDILDRDLNESEVLLVERKIGNYIDWHLSVENAIDDAINE